MADTEKTPAMLLDEIASLDPQARREVAHHTRTKSWGTRQRRHLLFETAGPQWLRCAVPFDPLSKRVLERGRDVHTGAVCGLLKPLDQVGAD